MEFPKEIFTPEERASFALRALYRARGYQPYRMSKFEEYDLYARNKDFLLSGQVITFTDTDGKLMALKPDVTLSIAKNFDAPGAVQKVYYNENVYRPSAEGGFKEILQSGVECMGAIGAGEEEEILKLAAESLSALGGRFALSVSHLGILDGLCEALALSEEKAEALCACVRSKNAGGAEALCREAGAGEKATEALLKCILSSASLAESARALLPFAVNETMRAALGELVTFAESAALSPFADAVGFDFSVLPDRRYYGGVVFSGYLSGVPTAVLSGGRYDKLMRRLAKDGGAIGFALYLDRLAFLDAEGGN